MMRLDRFLTEMGRGSRTEVKKLIAKQRVRVNGLTAGDPGQKIDPGRDTVSLDGEDVSYAAFEYYLLNKPQGVISASKDLRDRRQICVTDLIHTKKRQDLFPVGRLDKDTEGLLLITNDGALAHRLLSPKRHVDKTYEVTLDGELTGEAVQRLCRGVDIGDDKPTLPCEITQTGPGSSRITIREGRFHQIKRMFETENLYVTALKRISMGPLRLDPELKPGEYRELTKEEHLALEELMPE